MGRENGYWLLYRVDRVDLIEKVIFDERLEGGKETITYLTVWGNSSSNKCKYPKEGNESGCSWGG